MRRAIPSILAVGLVAVACKATPVVVRQAGGERFVPTVADTDQNSGAGLAIAADADGNPRLAYLRFEHVLEKGEIAPPPVFGAPELPAVMVATYADGIWTHVAVTEKADVKEGDEAAIAVDGKGVNHVVWTEGGSLRYASDAGGEFSKPTTVGPGEAPAMAASGGSVWLAFLQGGSVKAATLHGKTWSVETVASSRPGPSPQVGIAMDGTTPVIAFEDGERAIVARRSGGWSTRVAIPHGGVGVGLTVDRDGSAVVTGVGAAVVVSAEGGGRFQGTDAGEPGPAATSTAIALDGDGLVHLGWQNAHGITAANERDGGFDTEVVAGGEGGVRPRMAAGSEETVFLAWYDPVDEELQVGIRSKEAPFLAVPSPSAAASPTAGGGGPAPCHPSGTTVKIAAPSGASVSGFDTNCLGVPKGQPFTVNFTNADSTVHDWAVYTDQNATDQLGGGSTSEPVQTETTISYEVDALDPGHYFFRCDFHPTTMTGTLVVE